MEETMGQGQWIPIKEGAEEDTPYIIKVEKSGLKSMLESWPTVSSRMKTVINYETAGIWKGTFKFGQAEYDTILVPGATATVTEGEPAIPMEGLFVAIPNLATNVQVKVIDREMEQIPGKLMIKPAPKPISESEYIAGKEEYKPNPGVYNSDKVYPGMDFYFHGIEVLGGASVAHLILYLAQYNPLSKSLSVVKSMKIEISYDVPPKPETLPEGIINFRIGDLILDFDNAVALDSAGDAGTSNQPTELLNDTALHWLGVTGGISVSAKILKRTNINSQYVIITPDSVKNYVEPLRRAKSGYNAMVATIEDIEREFPVTPLSRKESIKAFIKYTQTSWQRPRPQFIVLAGDTNKIPIHPFSTYYSCTSDHYYANIKNDLAPEIIVSRIPTSDTTTMGLVCGYLEEYPNLRSSTANGNWQTQVALVSHQDGDFINISNSIARIIGNRFTVTKLYAQSTTSGSLQVQAVKDRMNSGVLIANYRGHGLEDKWNSLNGLNTTEISNLHNANNAKTPPLVFCICCLNACIDGPKTTVVETFIRERKAVAVVGASRESWIYPGDAFDVILFDAINSGKLTPGDIFLYAKTKMVSRYKGYSAYEDEVKNYMLFGDPSAKVI